MKIFLMLFCFSSTVAMAANANDVRTVPNLDLLTVDPFFEQFQLKSPGRLLANCV